MRDLSNGRGSGLPCVPRTPPAERCDMSDQRDAEDRTESSENADPMENADMKEPTDPTDRAEPTDPIDSTDPLDPIDRIDPSDHRDHFDVCGSDSVMTAIVPGGILRHRTRGPFTLPPNDTDAEPGGAEQERELHHVLGLEQEKRCSHEGEIEVAAHLAERSATGRWLPGAS
jgi:hypothetical protein